MKTSTDIRLILPLVVAVAHLTATPMLAAEVLLNDSFEHGGDAPDGWIQGGAVAGVSYIYDSKVASSGKCSLSLQKSANRFFPIAQWTREIPLDRDIKQLHVACDARATRVTKAIVDLQFFDAHGNPLGHEWAVFIGQKQSSDRPVTHDWKSYSGTVPVPEGTTRANVALQMYGPGKIWFDDLQLHDSDPKQGGPLESGVVPTDDAPANATEPAPSDADPIYARSETGAAARYLLLPPSPQADQPAAGYPLLLVLPGGDGSAEFQNFVTRIHERALDGKYVVAQLLAPPPIVWPTAFSQGMIPTTEDAIELVVGDVARRYRLDARRVYALGWSSGGPPLYAAITRQETRLAGVFIAMSVFKPNQLSTLEHAAGRRVYLLHSSDDSVCPFSMSEQAARQLQAAGTQVQLKEYPGGHGWHGNVFEQIKQGVDWLAR